MLVGMSNPMDGCFGHLEEITAYMEFFGMDVSVDEGHTIRLTLRSTGEDYLPASSSSQTNIQEGTGSTLQLDLIDLSTRLFYDVPACEHACALPMRGTPEARPWSIHVRSSP